MSVQVEKRGVTEQQNGFSHGPLTAVTERYSATYEALWRFLGDAWIDHDCSRTIRERSKRQSLTIESVTPYSLRVHYCGVEAEEAHWSVALTHEDADGWCGYDVCDVTSETGHTADALNEHLLTFSRLAHDSEADILRKH